jgi:uncharacterized integral membrane protein
MEAMLMNKKLPKANNDKKKVSWLAAFGILLAVLLLIF